MFFWEYHDIQVGQSPRPKRSAGKGLEQLIGTLVSYGSLGTARRAYEFRGRPNEPPYRYVRQGHNTFSPSLLRRLLFTNFISQ